MQVRVFAPFCVKRVDNRLEAFIALEMQCFEDSENFEANCRRGQLDMFDREARMDDFLGITNRVDSRVLSEILHNSTMLSGTSMMSTIGHDCHNTWHFFNRAAGWWHVMKYAARLGIERLDRVLIQRDQCLNKLSSMNDTDSWLHSVANAMFAPKVLNILKNQELRSFANMYDQEVSMFPESIKYSFSSDFTCFEKLVIPGRTRFFVSNFKDKRDMDSCNSNAPKSSIEFREKVRSYLGYQSRQRMTRKIVYAIRVKNRRGFSVESETRFQKILFELSTKHEFEVEIFNFHGSFKLQYEKVHDAAIMIGIHGQNLINSIFLPCDASLIEIFPFGFWSDAYYQGGYSGVNYHSLQSSVYRKPPPFLSEEFNNSLEVCNAHVHCRFYYKDKTNMRLSDSDWDKLYHMLESVMLKYQSIA